MTPRLVIEIPEGGLAVQAAPPELVSQKTSESVLGLPRRSFLAAVAAYRAAGHEVIEWGRLRLVERAPFVAWLRTPRPTSADEGQTVLEELGLRLVER